MAIDHPATAASDDQPRQPATDANGELACRQRQALAECEAQIRFFAATARQDRILHRASQCLTIVVSALVPVVLLSAPPEWFRHLISIKVLAAALSALVAIATGLSATFHWQEAWIRGAYFAQALTRGVSEWKERHPLLR